MKRILLLVCLPLLSHAAPPPADYDLCIYEATPGGIAMAVTAAREGLSVLLVNHHSHLGGILSSGLGVWDTLWEGKRSPVYDEAREAIFAHYRLTYGADSPEYRDALPGKSGHTNGKFEPKVAEAILTRMVKREANLTVLRGFIPASVERGDTILGAVTFRELDGTSEVRVVAKVFADCSYEGDLAALSRVPCRVGRESREQFGEPHAGVIFMEPLKEPPSEAIVRAAELHHRLKLRKFSGYQRIDAEGSTGAGDRNVQAFNYRTLLTSDPGNRLPVERPADYDPTVLRLLEHGSIVAPIPGSKRGWNRPQLIGLQSDYVEAGWERRQEIMDAHWDATMALLYFLQNDPSVEADRQASWREFGLAKDEFTDNRHRPYEIYVREARRIVGRFTFTQHDAMLSPGHERAPVHEDSIGVTEWYLDTHACTPRRLEGTLDEGKMMLDVETFPGQVPYRAILPQGLDNLLVPVCLSSTHVAWGTIRLEPTWMNLCESAAHAAALAVREMTAPARIDPDRLLKELVSHHIMIGFFNDLDVTDDEPAVAAAQFFSTKGFFPTYDARLGQPASKEVEAAWRRGLANLREGTRDPARFLDEVRDAESKPASGTGPLRGDILVDLWHSLLH